MCGGETLDMAAPLLFPHTWIREADLTRILAVCGSMTLCLPWFAEPPGFVDRHRQGSRVKILRPPESLKPAEEIFGVLKEYRRWMTEQKNAGQARSLQAAVAPRDSLEATWDIRLRLKSAGEPGTPEQEKAFQWHLVLYLARESESEQRQSQEMLAELKTSPSPVREALEDPASATGFLDDLPPSPPVLDENRLEQVLSAWNGLFSMALSEATLLLTVDRAVMEILTEAARDAVGQISCVPALLETEIVLPDLAPLPADHLTRWRRAFEDQGGPRMLEDLVAALQRGSAPRPKPLADLARELCQNLSIPPATGQVRLYLVHLPEAETSGPLFPPQIHNKVLACLEAFRGPV